MNEYWLFAICAAVFLIQLLLCFCCKKWLLRLLPALVPLLSGVACFILFYTTSGNWGWLMLAVILQNATGAAAAGWLVYGLYRLINRLKKDKV